MGGYRKKYTPTGMVCMHIYTQPSVPTSMHNLASCFSFFSFCLCLTVRFCCCCCCCGGGGGGDLVAQSIHRLLYFHYLANLRFSELFCYFPSCLSFPTEVLLERIQLFRRTCEVNRSATTYNRKNTCGLFVDHLFCMLRDGFRFWPKRTTPTAVRIQITSTRSTFLFSETGFRFYFF